MPIQFSCECGKVLRLKDEAAGKKVRCSGCQTVQAVPAPAVDRSAEDDALDFLLTDSPGDAPAPRPGRLEPPQSLTPTPARSLSSASSMWSRQARVACAWPGIIA